MSTEIISFKTSKYVFQWSRCKTCDQTFQNAHSTNIQQLLKLGAGVIKKFPRLVSYAQEGANISQNTHNAKYSAIQCYNYLITRSGLHRRSSLRSEDPMLNFCFCFHFVCLQYVLYTQLLRLSVLNVYFLCLFVIWTYLLRMRVLFPFVCVSC